MHRFTGPLQGIILSVCWLFGCNGLTGVENFSKGTDTEANGADGDTDSDSDSDGDSDTDGDSDADTDADTENDTQTTSSENCDNAEPGECFGLCSQCSEQIGRPCYVPYKRCAQNVECQSLRTCAEPCYAGKTSDDIDMNCFSECISDASYEGIVLFQSAFSCILCNGCPLTCQIDFPEESSCESDYSGCDYVTQFDCGDKCIQIEDFCDGTADCAGSEDESQCSVTLGDCVAPQYPCGDGGCFLMDDICDGYADCDNGFDESNDICVSDMPTTFPPSK